MKKLVVNSLLAITLAAAPMAMSAAPAHANKDFWNSFGGAVAGAVVGGVIANAVVAGQQHCHQGLGCHAHAGARAYHTHDQYGSIIYGQPVYEEPVQVYEQPVVRPGRLPRAHYDWCYDRYRSYDAGSNSYQPLGGGPRRQCRSPYAG